MMNNIKVFALASSKEEIHLKEKIKIIKELLDEAADMTLAGVVESDQKALDRMFAESPDVVLLLPDHSDEDISGIVQKIYLGLPACSLILICEETDFSSLQRVMKAGVRNVLKWPLAPKELENNIRYLYNIEALRLNSKPQAEKSWQSRVVTVFGTKGGIGKTTISVNLAAALARLGKKVAVIDLDLQFGDVGVFFDIDTKDGIAELVSENNFDAEKIKSYMQLHQSGVSILCAPKSPEYAEAVNADHIEKIIDGIRGSFDFIIIDTPSIFNDITIAALERSDLILFILTLDVSTLRNAKTGMGILGSLHNREKTRVILNREVESSISLKDAEKILKAQIFSRVPGDWKTATMSLNKGVPFVIDMPNTKISAALFNLAKQIDGKHA